MDYRVTEKFYSCQGEGPTLGTPAFFIRLAGCSVGCEMCDSKYAWPVPEETVDEVALHKELHQSPARLVVITGGEPLQQDIVPLLQEINDDPLLYKIEVETSCVTPASQELLDHISSGAVIRFNCSPKLPSAHAKQAALTLAGIKHFVSLDSIFKFVVDTAEDIELVEELVLSNNIDPETVYLMPKAVTQEELLEKSIWLIEQCKDYGYIFTPRLHIWLWGARRGV